MQSLQPANVETKVTCIIDDSKVVKCENTNSGAHCSSAVSTSDPSSIGDTNNIFLNYLRQRSSKILIKHLIEEEKINMVVLNLKPCDDYSLEVSLAKIEEGNHLGHNREQKGCHASGQVEEDNHLLNNRETNACLANGEVKEDNHPLYTREVLLDYVDKQELPYALVDKWGSMYPQLFYNGCVIVQIKDFRHSKEPQIRYTVLRPHNQSMINDSNLIADTVGGWTRQDRLFLESSMVKSTHEHLNLNPSTSVGLRRFTQHISKTALLTERPLRKVARHSQRVLSKRPKVDDVRLGHFTEAPSKPPWMASLDHKARPINRKNKSDVPQSHLILRSILKPDEPQQWKFVQDGRNHDERPPLTTNSNDCKVVEGIREVNSAIYNDPGNHTYVNESNAVSTVHQEAHKLVPHFQSERRAVPGQKDTVPIQTSNGAVNVSADTPSFVARSRLHLNHTAFPSSRNAYSSHVGQLPSQPSSSLMFQLKRASSSTPHGIQSVDGIEVIHMVSGQKDNSPGNNSNQSVSSNLSLPRAILQQPAVLAGKSFQA